MYLSFQFLLNNKECRKSLAGGTKSWGGE